MTSCQHAGNLYIPFLKNASFFDAKKLTSACLISSSFLNFLPLKKFCLSKKQRTKTSDNQRVLSLGNMVDATEFSSLVLQFFDKCPKQHVVWHYHDAV